MIHIPEGALEREAQAEIGGNPLDVRRYRNYVGTSWPELEFNRRGYFSVETLPELWGKQLSEVTLGFVQGLRPSMVRIVEHGVSCDAMPWRVTIWIKSTPAKDIVRKITQEIEVALPEGIEHGQALYDALQKS